MSAAGISTHVLDTSRGTAASGVAVSLERAQDPSGWLSITSTRTDADGRVKTLLPVGTDLVTGTYRLRFDTGAYFAERGTPSFFPHVEIAFTVTDASRHHHVPLLISPFGYSTYRGT